ncbi:MAG: hypothetical protein RIR67_1348 [Bacteroidota bacterium]|jgi:hypothetical protein
MKPDSSLALFQKYFNLKNRSIEIELKNHEVLKGKFIGYFRGNKDYITKWHFTTTVDTKFGRDQFGFLIGQLIEHRDILSVRFLEDDSIIYLNTN